MVPTAPVRTKRAPLRKKEALDNGVVVSVARLESVDGKAEGPGEVAGPALRVSISVQNKSRQEISMDLALVNVYYGEESTPASPLSGPGGSPLEGVVEAGRSDTGSYVFSVPEDQRDDVQVEFSYTTDAPTVIFSGAV